MSRRKGIWPQAGMPATCQRPAAPNNTSAADRSFAAQHEVLGFMEIPLPPGANRAISFNG